MDFTLQAPFSVLMWTTESAAICQQAGPCYIVRFDLPLSPDVGPLPFTAVGPYTDVNDALAHLADLPPRASMSPLSPAGAA